MLKEIQFTAERIVVPPIQLPGREAGACVNFHGIVRELERGEPLTGLGYEAYLPMATRLLDRIFDELCAAHPCQAVTFIHRLGWVPVGEVSLFLRVVSAHRGEALAFCGHAIDRMKSDVPIWKVFTAPVKGGAN